MTLYTNLLIKFINQHIIEYKQAPEKIVLGYALEEKLICEVDPADVGVKTMGEFMGIPVQIDNDEPFLVRMVYYCETLFPDDDGKIKELKGGLI